MTDPSPLIITNLSFRYRDRSEPALRSVSLRLEPGELLLVAGASGCGKTTLVRCINGLIPRSYKGQLEGKILLQGQETTGMSLARISQIVGTVLQDPERQILGTRVLSEVAFGLENLGLEREEIRRRAEEALDYLGLSGLRDRETFHLSGGEKQKVALAGVLAMRPNILILDEPLASLDPASAQETLAFVRRLVDEGKSVVMIEHRVEDVLRYRPDRVLYLVDGETGYLGDTQGLLDAVDYRQVKLPARSVMARVGRAVAAEVPDVQALPPRAEEPLVRFEDVDFEYEPGAEVLRGVSLDVHRGEVIAVLGPNGAGKTTLVKHAIGLLRPTRGRVLVAGKDTRQQSVAEIASTLGYVFQSPSHMLFAPTVEEELTFGPTNLGHRPEEIREEVMRALEIVNLTGREKDPPLAMSFGQQKRVSIAAILAMRSRILVMDEPTAGQDYRNYMDFMDAIVQMPAFEAILFITHDLDLAVVYANRVLLLGDGRVVGDGGPADVLGERERLRACRVLPTSLLEANLDLYPKTGRFLRAEALAQFA